MRARSAVRRLAFALAGAVGLGAALSGCGGSDDPFLGKRPPTLASAAATLRPGTLVGELGTAPLDWGALFGNVVYLQFGFLR